MSSVVGRKTINRKVLLLLLLVGCVFVAKQVDSLTPTLMVNGKFDEDNAVCCASAFAAAAASANLCDRQSDRENGGSKSGGGLQQSVR